eukprot:1684908-Prymnesium_polylepis.1
MFLLLLACAILCGAACLCACTLLLVGSPGCLVLCRRPREPFESYEKLQDEALGRKPAASAHGPPPPPVDPVVQWRLLGYDVSEEDVHPSRSPQQVAHDVAQQ